MKKLLELMNKYEHTIIVIVLICSIVSVSFNLYQNKQIKEYQEQQKADMIIHKKESILFADSLKTSILDKQREQLEKKAFEINLQIIEIHNRIKQVENENNKLQDIYRNIVIDRPEF